MKKQVRLYKFTQFDPHVHNIEYPNITLYAHRIWVRICTCSSSSHACLHAFSCSPLLHLIRLCCSTPTCRDSKYDVSLLCVLHVQHSFTLKVLIVGGSAASVCVLDRTFTSIGIMSCLIHKGTTLLSVLVCSPKSQLSL